MACLCMHLLFRKISSTLQHPPQNHDFIPDDTNSRYCIKQNFPDVYFWYHLLVVIQTVHCTFIGEHHFIIVIIHGWLTLFMVLTHYLNLCNVTHILNCSTKHCHSAQAHCLFYNQQLIVSIRMIKIRFRGMWEQAIKQQRPSEKDSLHTKGISVSVVHVSVHRTALLDFKHPGALNVLLYGILSYAF